MRAADGVESSVLYHCEIYGPARSRNGILHPCEKLMMTGTLDFVAASIERESVGFAPCKRPETESGGVIVNRIPGRGDGRIAMVKVRRFRRPALQLRDCKANRGAPILAHRRGYLCT